MHKTITFLITITLLSFADNNIFKKAAMIGRGVNLGNHLEAPNEGDWGEIIKEEYFGLISQKGFNSVRVPIRWSAHTAIDSPFTIDSVFLKRIDWVVENSLKNNLIPIIDIHHYNELFENPDNEKSKFLSIWKQLSNHYKDYSDSLFFEIMNEPNTNLTTDKWNIFFKDAISIIRKTNPTRPIIIGTANWGGVNELYNLKLPPNDTNLIVTVHYYSPFHFTHQGAEWVDSSQHPEDWIGTTWDGSYLEKLTINADMDIIKSYSNTFKVPVFIGEFGTYNKADIDSRARWTEYCSRIFESLGFSWTYWEFCAGFGVYDNDKKEWNTPILDALISDDTTCLTLDSSLSLGNNLIINGNFSIDTAWIFGAWQGVAKGKVVDEEYKVTVSKIGQEVWNIQLMQKELTLDSNITYFVSFKAYSPDNAILSASVSKSDFTQLGATSSIKLTTEKKKYFFTFKTTAQINNASFVVNVGYGTDTIFIDDVLIAQHFKNTAIISKSDFSTKNNLIKIIQTGNYKIIISGFTKKHPAVNYSIIDIHGKTIIKNRKLKKGIFRNEFVIESIKGLSSGIYLLLINDSKKTIYTRKFKLIR